MIKPGIYKHYKGELYRVHFGDVKRAHTLEPMVVYECLYDNPASKFFVRPLSEFQEKFEFVEEN